MWGWQGWLELASPIEMPGGKIPQMVEKARRDRCLFPLEHSIATGYGARKVEFPILFESNHSGNASLLFAFDFPFESSRISLDAILVVRSKGHLTGVLRRSKLAPQR